MSPIEDLNLSLYGHPELTLDLCKGFSHSLYLLVHANKHTDYSFNDLDTSNAISESSIAWHVTSDLLSIKDSSRKEIPICLDTEADGAMTLELAFKESQPPNPFQKHVIGYLSRGTLAALRRHLMAGRVYTVQLAQPKVTLRSGEGEEAELHTQTVSCDMRPIEFTVVAGTPIPRFEYTMVLEEALDVFHAEKWRLNLTVTCLSQQPVVVLFRTEATRRRIFTPAPRIVKIDSLGILVDDLTDPLNPLIKDNIDLYVLRVQNSSQGGSAKKQPGSVKDRPEFIEVQHDSAGEQTEREVLFTRGGRLTLRFRICRDFQQRLRLGHAYWFRLDGRVDDVGFSHWRYANDNEISGLFQELGSSSDDEICGLSPELGSSSDDEICGLPQGLVIFKEPQRRPHIAWDDHYSTEAVELRKYLAGFQHNGPIVFEPVRARETTEMCIEKEKPWPLFKLPRELRDLIYWYVKHSNWAKGRLFRVHEGRGWEAQKAEEREALKRLLHGKH
ncbi:MAG: hypothetical protein LQ351_001299 [Letrouitia transgressa]|nr:MAG: hypothetical protein LQ351_001299 [Letrouitia transgressa]